MSDPEGVEPEEATPPAGPQPVTIQRSVRIVRLLVAGGVLGAVVGAVVTILFPVSPDAAYSLWQVVGFMALVGLAVGLAVGAVVALILQAAVRRRRGAAIAERVEFTSQEQDAQHAQDADAAQAAPQPRDPGERPGSAGDLA